MRNCSHKLVLLLPSGRVVVVFPLYLLQQKLQSNDHQVEILSFTNCCYDSINHLGAEWKRRNTRVPAFPLCGYKLRESLSTIALKRQRIRA